MHRDSFTFIMEARFQLRIMPGISYYAAFCKVTLLILR
jgi:hypothetical protein